MGCADAPVVVTVGEPAGVGPEIIAQAWRDVGKTMPFFVIGDPAQFEATRVPLRLISEPHETASAMTEGLPVLAHPFPAPTVPGVLDGRNAPAVLDVIASAVKLIQDGTASALCTAPIHKQHLQQHAGFGYPGHTEFLAALSGVNRVVMMLACAQLKVVPVTIHMPLSQVPEALTADLVRDTIQITANALRQHFAIAAPRIAVAGLNPHAGEGGAMGNEEQTVIEPVLNALRRSGMTLLGPMPADTMFHDDARSRYDAAICMYHDQALIPIKTLDFAGGVNLTLGLPYVRSSPDHGTALDIAGQGVADATSMIAALRSAQNLAKARAHAV